jgi:ubiquinol-cytochrome c reductase cytochrome b subunit
MSSFRKAVDWLERRINLSEIFSFVTTFGISYVPVNTSLPLEQVAKESFLQPMPSYERWPHIFGILTFVTFLLEVVTGLLLAFYYQPAASAAYESTRFIIRDSAFGWYIHQMHFWGGQLLAVLLGVRLLRFIWHRVYKPPRELTWVFGAILFLLAVEACFTGKLLPWDQYGYWGTIRGLELIRKVPIVGSVFQYFVGGFAPNEALLLRFYLLHVIFMPLLIFIFFYLHFATVRRVGLSSVPHLEEKAAPIYPKHVMNLLIIMLILFGGILSLAMLFPDPFSGQSNPYVTPKGMSVSWFLLPVYGLFELLPAVIASWISFLILALILLVPFIDRGEDGPRRRWRVGAISLFLILVLIGLSYIGYTRRG